MKNMLNPEGGFRDLWGAGIKSINKSEAGGNKDGEEVGYGDEYVEERVHRIKRTILFRAP